MTSQRNSLVMEGVYVGLVGAVVLALWYLIFDVAAGQPLQTVASLSGFLSGGFASRGQAAVVAQVTPGSIVFYLALFILIGLGLTKLAELANHNRTLRMGVWLGLVIAFAIYLILTVIGSIGTGQPLPIWRVVAGSFLSTAAMAALLLWRHPHLRSGNEPLGAEGKAPPHPAA